MVIEENKCFICLSQNAKSAVYSDTSANENNSFRDHIR